MERKGPWRCVRGAGRDVVAMSSISLLHELYVVRSIITYLFLYRFFWFKQCGKASVVILATRGAPSCVVNAFVARSIRD